MHITSLPLITTAFLLGSSILLSQDITYDVPTAGTLTALIEDEDTDGDLNITVDDPHIGGTERGDKRFRMYTIDGRVLEVAGTAFLANLLQELKLAGEFGRDTATLSSSRIYEPPADRISRNIREVFWNGLTRVIDKDGLSRILSDTKTATIDGLHYLYVPASDILALDYFATIADTEPDLNLKVARLPATVTGEYVRRLDGRHGLVALGLRRDLDGSVKGLPFAVPGGRFNEMYGWDSYFIVLGLLRDGHVDLARSMVDNFIYEIESYGAILNANRTYYLTRSQPPFFTSMALEVSSHLPGDVDRRRWLEKILTVAIKEYRTVWMGADRLTTIGLSRYFDSGVGQPPEVEPGHFSAIYASLAGKYGMTPVDLEGAYTAGGIRVPELDEFFLHDRAMRESGHDTSYRLIGRCADLVTVDLNSLLYKIEMDIAAILDDEFGGELRFADGTYERSSVWIDAAKKRRRLMTEYLWDEVRGMFFDYDVERKEKTTYVSATTFYPLWSGAATEAQARRLVRNALPLLEEAGGIVACTEESRGTVTPERPLRQWDYPHGWAPHQMLVWQGLVNYGYNAIARRLAYRWLYTITLNAAHYNGTIPEKFDVVRRSHQVFAEYGNVGTKFAYITREGFGWTNASFQVGVGLLTPELRAALNRLVPPEWVAWKE